MTLEWDHKNETTPSALMAHVRDVWESFRGRPQFCESLVSSMPRRIREVADAGGAYTKY